MITGVIKNNARNGSTLIVTLPCSLYDLRNHLASIGITSEASKLTVGGTENIKVQLAAAEPVGELVLSKLAQDDTLNYARTCKAAEDEEYGAPEDDWER